MLATQENVVAEAAACNITLTAYGAGDKEVGSKTLTFELNGLLSWMDVAQFDSKFSNVARIVFTFTGLVEDAPVVGLIDNFTFTKCTQ